MDLGDEEGVGGDPDHPLGRGPAEPSAKDSGFRRPARSTGANAEKAASGGRAPAPIFHPLAYRSVVADWPIAWREQWGQRANELEETGLSWRDAETQAFVELWHKLRHEGQAAQPHPDGATPCSDDAAPSSVDAPGTVVDVESSSVDRSSSPAD